MKSVPPLGQYEIDDLARMVGELGENEARGLLKISSTTLARALAGLSQQAGTINVIRLRLTQWKANQEAAHNDEGTAREGSEEA